MINYKSSKWCFGVVFSLGLTACNMMDFQRSEPVPTRYEPINSPQKAAPAPEKKAVVAKKSYASKDPTQKATPGPVRKAAPQLPVIE